MYFVTTYGSLDYSLNYHVMSYIQSSVCLGCLSTSYIHVTSVLCTCISMYVYVVYRNLRYIIYVCTYSFIVKIIKGVKHLH